MKSQIICNEVTCTGTCRARCTQGHNPAEMHKEIILALGLGFILYQTKKEKTILETSEGTRNYFKDRLKHLEFLGNKVLEKDFIEMEFCNDSGLHISSATERILDGIEIKKQKKLRLIKH